MASAVCQNQFLGSRISLVSKSEIRYEGILYALDLLEATISLAKVRSFGTEDRPTDRPLPAKDEVFEYIVFRGADIKVIDVVEPPKHAANSGMPGVPSDPAIVDFSHATGNGHFGGGNHFEGGRMRPSNNSRSGGAGPGMYGGPGGPNGNMRRRSGGFNDSGMQGGRGGNQNGRKMGMGGGGGQGGGRQQYGPPPRNNYGGYGNYRQGGYPNNNGGQFQQRGRVTTPNRGGNNFGQPRRGQQGNGGNRTPFRNRGMNQAAFPPKVAFDGDYDFEKANEELLSTLAKAKLEDENPEAKNTEEGQQTGTKEGEENKEPRTFYKKDDFFDNISCEALENSKGNVPRVDWKAERKLNAETFGLNPNNPNNGGRRDNPRMMMPRGGNMVRGPGGAGSWMMMPSNNYFRGGNRRQRVN